MRKICLLPVMLLPIMAGCATVDGAPDPQSVSLPPEFANITPSQQRADDSNGAQNIAQSPSTLLPMDDPAFIALRQQAMANAPDVSIALARIEQARAGFLGSKAAQRPNISGSAGADAQRISAAQFGGGSSFSNIIEQERALYNLQIAASWDADIFGRLRNDKRASLARLNAATASAKAVNLAIESDIARLVAIARWQQARLVILEQDIKSAGELARLTGQRAKAGLVPELDQIRANGLLQQSQAEMDGVRLEYAANIASLSALCGISVKQVQDIFAQTSMTNADILLDKGRKNLPDLAVPTEMLRARPDVKAAEFQLAASDYAIAAAAAKRYPRLSITSALGLISLGLGNLFTDEALVGSLGADISGPLLDFGRIAAEIDARQADASLAFQQYRQSLFVAMAEVESALGQIEAVNNQIDHLTILVDNQREAARLTRIRYRAGLDNFLTVLDAERSFYLSEQALLAARAVRASQYILLYRAIGGDHAIKDEAALTPAANAENASAPEQ